MSFYFLETFLSFFIFIEYSIYFAGKKGEKGEGFDVLKSGDARVAMIGFPSVGKNIYYRSEASLYFLFSLVFKPKISNIFMLAFTKLFVQCPSYN